MATLFFNATAHHACSPTSTKISIDIFLPGGGYILAISHCWPLRTYPASLQCNFCIPDRFVTVVLWLCVMCCDRKSRAAHAQSFALWQQATIEFTCHDHPIIACSRHHVLFFTHIPFVVNHTINATPPERLHRCNLAQSFQSIFEVEHQILMDEINAKSLFLRVLLA